MFALVIYVVLMCCPYMLHVHPENILCEEKLCPMVSLVCFRFAEATKTKHLAHENIVIMYVQQQKNHEWNHATFHPMNEL